MKEVTWLSLDDTTGVIYDANGQIEQADLKRLTESVVGVGCKTSL